MILDANGEEIEEPQPPQPPQPHKFGQFVVPENAHIKGFSALTPEPVNTVVWQEWMRNTYKTR